MIMCRVAKLGCTRYYVRGTQNKWAKPLYAEKGTGIWQVDACGWLIEEITCH